MSDLNRLAGRIAKTEKKVKALEQHGIGLGQSAFDNGAISQYANGVLGSQFGTQYDGSQGVYALNGPLPPSPGWGPGSTVTPVTGGIKVRWDGYFEPDITTVAPLGFTQVEVHVGTDVNLTGQDFSTLKSFITSARGGDTVVMLPPGNYYVRLVTRTNAGRASSPSLTMGPYSPGLVGLTNIDSDIQAKLATADSKNSVTFSTADPPSTNTNGRAGDIWFKRSTTDGKITGSWEWTGTAWATRVFGNAVLDSLTASKIVSGILQAGVKITIGNPAGERIDISSTAIEKVETDGTITFQVGIGGNTLIRGVLTGQSTNYVEGTAGWRLEEDGDAFLQNVQVADNLSAKTISTTNFNLGGVPLSSLLASRPIGLVARGIESTQVLQGIVLENGVCELGFIAYPNRGYLIVVDGPAWATSATDTSNSIVLRYTTDGSAPGVSSNIFARLIDEFGGPNGSFQWPTRTVKASSLFYPDVSNPAGQLCRILLTTGRSAGGGTVGVDCVGYRCQMLAFDMGPTLPNSIRVNNATAASPPPPPPAPVQTYTEDFYPTWTASYRADGSRWQDNEKMFQGNGDSFNGNQASLIGFDYTYMQGRLAGATLKSAKLYARNWWTWNSGGGTLYVGSHNLVGVPTTYTDIYGGERRFSGFTTRGGWVEIDILPILNEIKAGTSKGIVFGHAPNSTNSYYGYWYGHNYTDQPRVTTTWEK